MGEDGLSLEAAHAVLHDVNEKFRNMNVDDRKERRESKTSNVTGDHTNEEVHEESYLPDRSISRVNLLNNTITACLGLPLEADDSEEGLQRHRRQTKDTVRTRILRKQLFTERGPSPHELPPESEEQLLKIKQQYKAREKVKDVNRLTLERLLRSKMSKDLPGTRTPPSPKTRRSVSSLYSCDPDKNEINIDWRRLQYERDEDKIEVSENDLKNVNKTETVSLQRRSSTRGLESHATSKSSRAVTTTSSMAPTVKTIPSLRPMIPAALASYTNRATSRVTFTAPELSEENVSVDAMNTCALDNRSISTVAETTTTDGLFRRPKSPPLPFDRYSIRPLSNTSVHSAPIIRQRSVRKGSASSRASSVTCSGISLTFKWPKRSAGAKCSGKKAKDLYPVATGLRYEGTSIEKQRFRTLHTKGDIKIAKVWGRNDFKANDLPIAWARRDIKLNERPISPFQRR